MTTFIEVLTVFFLIILLTILFLLLEKFLGPTYQAPTNPGAWKTGIKINWPESKKNPALVAYVCAPTPSKAILNEAKWYVDVACPFRGGPNGGTFYNLRKREYLLNQYLWFYDKHGYLPTTEIITDPYPWRGLTWNGSVIGYEPHNWINVKGEKL